MSLALDNKLVKDKLKNETIELYETVKEFIDPSYENTGNISEFNFTVVLEFLAHCMYI